MTTTFEALKGKIIKGVHVDDAEARVTFTMKDGTEYLMWHRQDCCESVWLAETIGDWKDILGFKILEAEEVSQECDRSKEDEDMYYDDDCTWTFYKLRTIRGSITLRWVGTSNGYYSTSVSFDLYNESHY